MHNGTMKPGPLSRNMKGGLMFALARHRKGLKVYIGQTVWWHFDLGYEFSHALSRDCVGLSETTFKALVKRGMFEEHGHCIYGLTPTGMAAAERLSIPTKE